MKKILSVIPILLLLVFTQCSENKNVNPADRAVAPKWGADVVLKLDTIHRLVLVYARSTSGRTSENPLERIPYDVGGDLGCTTCLFGNPTYEYNGTKAVLYTFSYCNSSSPTNITIGAKTCNSDNGTQVYLLRNYTAVAYSDVAGFILGGCANNAKATVATTVPASGQYAALVFRDPGTTGTLRTQLFAAQLGATSCTDRWP